ncbi:MAG: DMT family transporter [Gemmatimonadetes bacterium]|nr:DMT family transporter [Gemmatimonadota bacterium]
MVLGAFFFSVMTLFVKMAGARLPNQEIVLIRGVLTLAFSWMMVRRAGVNMRGSRPIMLMLRGLFGFAALSCLYYAVVHLPLADATVLQYTNPVWTALLAAWFLKERMRAIEVLLVLCSLVGVVVIARPSFLFGSESARLDLFAVGVALSGAMMSAAAYVMVRKLSRTEHPLTIIYYFTLVTVPAAVPGTIAVAVWPTAREWLLLLGIGMAAQAGQVYLTRGLQLEPAGRATGAAYMQVVFAAIWGGVFFRELPDAWVILGASIILGSTLLLGRLHAGPVPPAPAADDAGSEAIQSNSR